MRLNLNQLGEAILGEGEAARRLDAYLALLAREDVEYISVKVSSVFEPDRPGRLPRTPSTRVKERLRALYRQAAAASLPPSRRPRHAEVRQPRHGGVPRPRPHGGGVPRGARRGGVPAPERGHRAAGLSARLPPRAARAHGLGASRAARAAARRSSCASSRAPTSPWSASRPQLHGWPQAPYATKAEVDANYKRMLEYGCRPEHARAVHLGIASHNLFDVAYGLVLREDERRRAVGRVRDARGHGQSPGAGGAGARRRPPALRAGRARRGLRQRHRLPRAPARREHRAEDNFLRHVFDLEPGSPAWARERDRFLAALRPRRRALSDAPAPDPGPRGRGARGDAAPAADLGGAVRQRARHRLVARRQPRTGSTASMATLARAPAGDRAAPDRRRAGRRRARRRRGATARVPERVAYRHALADRAARRAARSTRRARRSRPGRPGRPRSARALLDRRGRDARPAARRPDRRHDRRRRQDRGRGRPRGLGGGRLRALLRARARRGADELRELPDGAARRRGGGAAVELPALHPRRRRARRARRRQRASSSSPRPRRCWSAGSWPRRSGRPASRARCSSSCRVPTTTSGRGLITDPRVDARHPHRLGGDGAPLPRRGGPTCTLFAETSGKNAIIVTALADLDQAIRDLVRSAFGHAGQKCSAASLAICEAEVYDDAAFRRQLRDAAASLAVGQRLGPGEPHHPADPAAGRRAPARAHHARRGRGVAARAAPRSATTRALWSPGIKLGVRRGSFFHRTECFGPVLGLMRADEPRRGHRRWPNDTPFGLTGGIQSLDDREVDRWLERIEAGNLYVNRPITGAIVGRQPFGGWKASSVGPAPRPAGRTTCSSSRAGARWRCPPPTPSCSPRPSRRCSTRCLAELAATRRRRACCGRARPATRAPGASTSAASTTRARSSGERNVFRYRPVPRDDRAGRASTGRAAARAPAGRARRAHRRRASDGEPAPDEPWPWLAEHAGVTAVIESEAGFVERLAHQEDAERLRVLEPVSLDARAAAHAGGRDGDRRARPRHRPARASLVSPRADGLARAPPLRQRDRAPGRHVTEHGAEPCGPRTRWDSLPRQGARSAGRIGPPTDRARRRCSRPP